MHDHDMSNPFLKKNPIMSMWLSGFHAAAGAARGQAAAAAKRQGNAVMAEASANLVRLWMGLPSSTPRAAAKPRKRR